MLLAYLVQLADHNDAKVRQFAMYVFEVLSEIHLTSAQLTSSKNDFITIFQKGLNDKDTNVKVASLKAVTAFLSSIEEQEVVLGFSSILELVLLTVVQALQKDEEQGRIALESLADLTQAHPEVWKNPTQLIDVASQVILQTSFEDGTRSAAIEVVLALSGSMPAALRKAPTLKT